MRVSIVLVLAGAISASAQNPLGTDTKMLYTNIKNTILRSAEKMPEENYSFQPTPEVRTFGQLIGHLADGQYEFCSPVSGESKQMNVEKTVHAKADLIASLKAAFAYCDPFYNSLTDAGGAEKVKFFGREMTKFGMLEFNIAHDNEHYGNIVTYMRLKGLVPPSSERSR